MNRSRDTIDTFAVGHSTACCHTRDSYHQGDDRTCPMARRGDGPRQVVAWRGKKGTGRRSSLVSYRSWPVHATALARRDPWSADDLCGQRHEPVLNGSSTGPSSWRAARHAHSDEVDSLRAGGSEGQKKAIQLSPRLITERVPHDLLSGGIAAASPPCRWPTLGPIQSIAPSVGRKSAPRCRRTVARALRRASAGHFASLSGACCDDSAEASLCRQHWAANTGANCWN